MEETSKFPRKHVSKMAREHTDPVCYLVLFRVVKTKVNGDHSVNADIRDVSFTIVVVAIPLLPELRNNPDEATVSIVNMHFNIYVLGLHNIHMSCS